VSRRLDPMHPAVVTVGRIVGGDSHNAIPSSVTLQGTIRAYSKADRDFLHTGLRHISDSIAQAHGCSVSISVSHGEPVLNNDEKLAISIAAQLKTHGYVDTTPVKSCGADDFAFFSAAMPSLMIFAGVGDGSPESPGLHHPAFFPDDSSVSQVARIMLLAYFAAIEPGVVND
jgi:metal-dependent amidase/aminoacylase/carboxypeptidase family protein